MRHRLRQRLSQWIDWHFGRPVRSLPFRRGGVRVILSQVPMPDADYIGTDRFSFTDGSMWYTRLPAKPCVGETISVHLPNKFGLTVLVEAVHQSDRGDVYVSVVPDDEGWV